MMVTRQIGIGDFSVMAWVTVKDVLEYKPLRINGMDNLEMDTILQSKELRDKYIVKDLFPGLAPGTVVAYPRRGEKLAETISSDGVTYVVPDEVLKEFGGKKNTLLVLRRDFDMGPDLVINGKLAKMLILPDGDGWRLPDEEFGIPQGEKVPSDNPAARYGRFMDDSAYIGPLSRGTIGFNGGRTVSAGTWPEWTFGVGCPPNELESLERFLRDARRSGTKPPKESGYLKKFIRRTRALDIKEWAPEDWRPRV
jgi:hypothetical protein